MPSVYIVDGTRTPFLKARPPKKGNFSAMDLAYQATRSLLMQYESHFKPYHIQSWIMGCVMPRASEVNIARNIALSMGALSASAYTVARNCASGVQSIDNGYQEIALGRSDLALVGGVESMSHAPFYWSDGLLEALASFSDSRLHPYVKLKSLMRLRCNDFKPQSALMCGLTDPLTQETMGQTAENLAHSFHIQRDDMDLFAVDSHKKASNSRDFLEEEITPIIDRYGTVYVYDDGVRPEISFEKMRSLKPVFDAFGRITPGNSSQITDGACVLLLASEEAVRRYQLPVMGRIAQVQWIGLDPSHMGLGPAYAIASMLKKMNMSLSDIDYFEINEAFSAQVLSCLRVLEDEDYSRRYFGFDGAVGCIPMSALNQDGGAIAIGHPIGASGARVTLHALRVLHQQSHMKRAIASLCIGGGQGVAILLEKVSSI